MKPNLEQLRPAIDRGHQPPKPPREVRGAPVTHWSQAEQKELAAAQARGDKQAVVRMMKAKTGL